jgi:hypothetical protein
LLPPLSCNSSFILFDILRGRSRNGKLYLIWGGHWRLVWMINVEIGLLPDVEIHPHPRWGRLLELRSPPIDISSAIRTDLHLGENEQIPR